MLNRLIVDGHNLPRNRLHIPPLLVLGDGPLHWHLLDVLLHLVVDDGAVVGHVFVPGAGGGLCGLDALDCGLGGNGVGLLLDDGLDVGDGGLDVGDRRGGDDLAGHQWGSVGLLDGWGDWGVHEAWGDRAAAHVGDQLLVVVHFTDF
jgi:hypothetical protein